MTLVFAEGYEHPTVKFEQVLIDEVMLMRKAMEKIAGHIHSIEDNIEILTGVETEEGDTTGVTGVIEVLEGIKSELNAKRMGY